MMRRNFLFGKRILALFCSIGMMVSSLGTNVMTLTAMGAQETGYEDLYEEGSEVSIADRKVVRATVGEDILNFQQASVYNVADNYTDGKISGTYKSEKGEEYAVTVYRDGVGSYWKPEDTSDSNQYGCHCAVNKVVFAVELPTGSAKYTFRVAAGTGSARVMLYSDEELTNGVLETEVAVPGDVVYKKSSDEAQTLYFVIKSASNYYMKNVNILKEEYKEEKRVLYKNQVVGIEDDDQDVELTFTGSTEVKTVSANGYEEEGIQLIAGETYSVVGVGKKAIYKSADIVAQENGASVITLKRVEFDLPLNLTNSFEDMKLYLSSMGYSAQSDVMDPYSGLVIHANGMNPSNFGAQYGASINGDKVISFTAKKSGTLTVTVSVTAADGNDKFALEINGERSGDEVPAEMNKSSKLTVNVQAGDLVTLLSTVHINLYYNGLSAQYEDEGWKVKNADDNKSGTAEFDGMGFVYHSLSTAIGTGSSGGKDCVSSGNSNGQAVDGIVVTIGGVSYADYTAPEYGTLTVYVGKADTKKGYVSTKDKAIAEFVPGGTGDYDAEGFRILQGETWSTLYIEVEKGETYYVNVAGSKMKCYGAAFVPYTVVSGNVIMNESAATEECTLKFTDKEDDVSYTFECVNGAYEKRMKPGNYVISLVGETAKKYAVSAGTKRVTVKAGKGIRPHMQRQDVKLEDAVFHRVSGKLTGFDTIPSNLKILLVPNDKDSYDTIEALIDGDSYSALLPEGEAFRVAYEGAFDYELSEEISVLCENADVSKDIGFKARALYEVSGGFLGLTQVRGEYETLDVTPLAISFKNVDDGSVYAGTVLNGRYSARLRSGAYLAAITSDGYSTSTHVVVKDANTERDLLLKSLDKVNVEYKSVLRVGKDQEYKTVQAAVDAVAAMGARSEEQRVTIKIAPGTYREQVVVNAPYITLESDGGSRNDTKITWYYGIGYKYYSCVDSYYDPYADYDRFNKGDAVKHWGSAVIIQSSATAFRAKDICFENSFNKYMTEEEIADGVEPNGLQSINVARRVNTVVDSKAATERAAAYVNYADRTEFLHCSFIGSQDTLYTCNKNYDAYYKNCYIEGQTDYIYGNGDVIFDGCELNFCGYSETAAAGYLTAQSSADDKGDILSSDGYIFRNCYMSYNGSRKVTAGYLGRMWGKNCTVTFLNTQLEKPDMIVGAAWGDMNQKVSSDLVRLTEYNTTYAGNTVDYSGRAKGNVDHINASDYSVQTVFIDKGWTPAYYTEEKDEDPSFAKKPTFSSNGDLNIPKPGEKVTVSYSLGADFDGSDASRIEWYAVAPGYDDSSLENILKSAVLLKASSAVSGRTFRIPMECAGKYLMAVVTPVIFSGRSGKTEFLLNVGDQPVGSEWSDPDDAESVAPGSGINIYLAGDSTVKDYSALGMYNGGKILAEGSWGEFFQAFFNNKYVTVNNYAQGGRAVRSFLNEGKLDDILKNIKEGDYLFVQFGHNDCANGKSYYEDRFVPLYTAATKADTHLGEKYPTSGFPTIVPTDDMKGTDGKYAWNCGATYKGFIQYYINKALEKKAIPVIVTPVARLYYSGADIRAHHDANMTDFDATMDFRTEGDAYVTACRELYEENKDNGVLFLDAFAITKQIYIDAYKNGGGEQAGEAMMAKNDKTHSNKSGGVIQAAYLARVLQDMNISISKYIKNPESVYGEETTGEFIFEIDKDGRFIARDKEYRENAYMTGIGQAKFDEIKDNMKTADEGSTDGKDEGSSSFKSDDSSSFKSDDSSSFKSDDSSSFKSDDSSSVKSEDSSSFKSEGSSSAKSDDSSSFKSDDSSSFKSDDSSSGKSADEEPGQGSVSGNTASENRVTILEDKGRAGFGGVNDTIPVIVSEKKAQIVFADDVKEAAVTMPAGQKLTIMAQGATDFVSTNPAVKVTKKGTIKIKKGFEGEVTITFTVNGETKTLIINCINPSIDTLGTPGYQVKNLTLTADTAAGESMRFAVKAPLNAAFDTTSSKYRNKGILDQVKIGIGEDGRFYVTAEVKKNGTVVIPLSINGKTSKLKIKVRTD